MKIHLEFPWHDTNANALKQEVMIEIDLTSSERYEVTQQDAARAAKQALDSAYAEAVEALDALASVKEMDD